MEPSLPSEGIDHPTAAPGPAARPEPPSGSAPESSHPPGYSIAAVSKLTGISCHTLRVWERRYGFPVPARSPSGHRRYSREQVQTLCHLTHLNRTARQSIGELIARWHETHAGPGAQVPTAVEPADDELCMDLVRSLVAGDIARAEREYEALASRLAPLPLVEQVICPALTEAGDGWFRRSHSVYHERLITVFLRKKMGRLIDQACHDNMQPGRSVLSGTVQGDRHEGGVLAFHLAMELRGWRVLNLGVDLPIDEYQAAVEQLRPSALALSFILSRNIKKRFHELESLKAVPVFVGGRSIVNYQSLARSHGLIPLVGPISQTAEMFVVECDHWWRQRRGGD